MIKIPSFADPHVHLREPGSTDKEDFYTGTCAALAGGYTAVLDMPNNSIPTITAEALREKQQLAAGKIVCDVGFNFGATPDNGSEYSKIAAQVAGLKAYFGKTHGQIIFESLGAMLKIFQNWPPSPQFADKPILIHAEGQTIAAVIGLAAIYDRCIHICHLSKQTELEVIQAAKDKGIKITCEVAPHHLFLTEQAAAPENLGPYARMSPPLQTQADITALWAGLADGSIDMVATDHAPHTRVEKESRTPPFGVPGLETVFPLIYREVAQGRAGFGLERLIELMSIAPRRVFGMPLGEGEVEIDENEEFEFTNENLFTKCGWTPFVGLKGLGRVKRVWLRGTLVFEDGKVLAEPGSAKVLDSMV
jgi:carbamoyl-phosphate synthase/aspartate carbamoyltransferase/dihydroorotase